MNKHNITDNGQLLGTCQICFRSFAVTESGNTVLTSKHGYTRPGDGHEHGWCSGEYKEPFEVAKDLTEAYRDGLINAIAAQREHVAGLRDGSIQEVRMEIGLPRSSAWEKRRTEFITITPVGPNPRHWPTWEIAVERKIWNTESDIRQMESNLSFVVKRLAGWTYCPETMVDGRAKAEARDRAAAEAKRAARADAKAAKLAATAARKAKMMENARRDVDALLGQQVFLDYLATRTTYRKGVEIPMLAAYQAERAAACSAEDFSDLRQTLRYIARDARAAGHKVRG